MLDCPSEAVEEGYHALSKLGRTTLSGAYIAAYAHSEALKLSKVLALAAKGGLVAHACEGAMQLSWSEKRCNSSYTTSPGLVCPNVWGLERRSAAL